MQLKTNNIKISVLIFVLLLTSCNILRKKPEIALPKAMDVDAIVHELQENQLDYEWFSARFSGYASFDDGRNNISGTIRIRKDSAIFISVTPLLGIEAFRALITPDSIKFINRLEGSYFKGGFNNFSRLFNTGLDFYIIQALLTGNDLPNFNTNRFKLTQKPTMWQLQDVDRKNTKTGKSFKNLLLVDVSSWKIKSNQIDEIDNERSLQAKYLGFEHVKGQLVPNKLSILLTNRSAKARLNLTYSRISINQAQNIDFLIPMHYTPLEF